MYLFRLNASKANNYTTLPTYLQNDPEVANRVVEVSPSLINHLSIGMCENVLLNHPDYFSRITNAQTILKVLQDEPQLIVNLPEYDLYSLVYNERLVSDREFIKYMPENIQLKMLSDDFLSNSKDSPTHVGITPFNGEERKKQVSKYLGKFSSDILARVASEDKASKKRNKAYKPRLYRFDLKVLPIEEQIKLAFIDNDYLSMISKDAVSQFMGNNPLLTDELESKISSEAYKKNSIEKIRFKNTSLKEAFTRLVDMKYADSSFDYENAIDETEKNLLWELGKLDPDFLHISEFSTQERIDTIIEILRTEVNEYNNNGAIAEYLSLSSSKKNYDAINALSKFITCKDVMVSMSQDVLLEYALHREPDLLNKIIIATFGGYAKDALDVYSRITIDEIPNFYIFSSKVKTEFALEHIQHVLSHKMLASSVMALIAMNQYVYEAYQKFNLLTLGMFGSSSIEIENKVRAFIHLIPLMRNLKSNELNATDLKNLELAILDKTYSTYDVLINAPTTETELVNYEKYRNQIYDDAISKVDSFIVVKEFMSKKFFGLDYSSSKQARSYTDNISLLDVCNFIIADKNINDSKTLKSSLFTEDELDILNLIQIFAEIEDAKMLKELNFALNEKQDVISPRDLKILFSKIPIQYSEDAVKFVLNPKIIDKIIERQGENPHIQKEEKDGVNIITFNGSDYTFYISSPFLQDRYFSNPKSIEDLVSAYKTNSLPFEGTIVSNEDIRISIGKDEIALGKFAVNPNQVLGLGVKFDTSINNKKPEYKTRNYINPTVFYNPDIIDDDVKVKSLTTDLAKSSMPDFIIIDSNTNPKINKVVALAKEIGISYVFVLNDIYRTLPTNFAKEARLEV